MVSETNPAKFHCSRLTFLPFSTDVSLLKLKMFCVAVSINLLCENREIAPQLEKLYCATARCHKPSVQTLFEVEDPDRCFAMSPGLLNRLA